MYNIDHWMNHEFERAKSIKMTFSQLPSKVVTLSIDICFTVCVTHWNRIFIIIAVIVALTTITVPLIVWPEIKLSQMLHEFAVRHSFWCLAQRHTEQILKILQQIRRKWAELRDRSKGCKWPEYFVHFYWTVL